MSMVMAYGGGTNSVAMLVGFKERGIRPDLIIFSDTGGERPETYAHLLIMDKWCSVNGFPEIIRVAEGKTLEQDCLDRNSLPAIAYGFKTCSERWKIRPQKRYLKANEIDLTGFYVGIDAGERHRVKDDPTTHYPLVEWGWGRNDCIAAIKREGIPLPGKSSCFFCPSMRPPEIRALQVQHPDLMERAIKIESGADLTAIRGLGRNFAWKNLIATDDMFADEYFHTPDIPCECWDGESI